MKDIKCPKCGTVFQVDDNDYAAIAAQVRGEVFDQELRQRVKEVQARYDAREETIKLNAEKEFDSRISKKEQELGTLQNEITRLSGIIAGYEATKKTELTELESRKDREIFNTAAEKDRKIATLESALAGKDSDLKLALAKERNEAELKVQKKEQEIMRLQADIEAGRLAAENRESQIREQHKLQLQDKQDEIDRLKDFKMRLSTKMVGETLEQHCSIQFEQARSMGLYPEASFEKDNTVVEHSKGDFVFRDYVDGHEYVSVMFEMKNEMDTTSTKHRNDDFLEIGRAHV